MIDNNQITQAFDQALALAQDNTDGRTAAYIPELAQVDDSLASIAITDFNGERIVRGTGVDTLFTLQSVAKLVVLIGVLEEFGPQKVFSWVRMEPSGDDFASIARLDQFGPVPSNPMLNAGAISLCSRLQGNTEQRLTWLEKWMEKLFAKPLSINQKVYASEQRTGDRNRSLAYLLRSNNIMGSDIDAALETYFYLCSFEVDVQTASSFAMLLANGGKNHLGEQILSLKTVQIVVSLMATCGMYNESGAHLVRAGMPAKSGVSGCIIAIAAGLGGIAVYSPRVNRKGTSVRGAIMLESVSNKLNLHFATRV